MNNDFRVGDKVKIIKGNDKKVYQIATISGRPGKQDHFLSGKDKPFKAGDLKMIKPMPSKKGSLKDDLKEIIREIIREYLTEANTPWGKSDTEYPIERGVVWYGTPGHGGLGIAASVAKKKLTPQAIALGDKRGGTYWYEEDVAWTIPFYENPEWDKKLVKQSGGKSSSKSYLASQIKSYFPEYFDKKFIAKASGSAENAKNFPKLELKDVITLYGSSEYQIIDTSGKSYIVVDISNMRKYKVGIARFKRDATKVQRPDGSKLKTIWEKK